jgi:hypothetical protein
MSDKEIDPVKFYLDYWNDYLTVECIAEHYGITTAKGASLIDAGRIEFNKGK